jgi:hypothetical protein
MQAASPPEIQSSIRAQILVPFDPREAMPVRGFAVLTGLSVQGARDTVHAQGLGRKIGNRWFVSRPASAMYLDGDHAALAAYWRGDRSSDLVRPYFERLGIDPASLGQGG